MIQREHISNEHPGGWPVNPLRPGLQRFIEAWWALTGQWSLHKAWKAGFDAGAKSEHNKMVLRKGQWASVFAGEYAEVIIKKEDGSPKTL